MSTHVENPLEKHQAEHLILLIGGNPLPNYVAGMLLASDGATVHLVATEYTREKGGTSEIAKNVGDALTRDRPTLKAIRYETDETDGNKICATLNQILDTAKQSERVGFNYTGGTKPMVRHATRALADRVQEFPKPIYSYLDARTLQMAIERSHKSPLYFPVRDAVQPGFTKLFDLHGFVIEPPRQAPKQFEICDALRELYVTQGGRSGWWDYFKKSPLKQQPSEGRIAHLELLREKLRKLDASESPNLMRIANSLGYETFPKTQEFFEGKWLEEYALEKLRIAAEALGNIDIGIGMKATKPGSAAAVLELDLAALRGYQLFAVSCQATTKSDAAQEHFFEIYVRATQVGGDEARFALVCLLEPNETKHLQQKLETTWDVAGKLRVFGAHDLAKLDAHFKDWLENAN